jgi:ribosome-binding factor A
MSQRTQRVDELLRQEITAILAKEVADPEIGFATVTDVETSPDLRHARVWVSVIGQNAERDAALRALQRAMGYVRRELGRRLRIRRIPELQVRLDGSAERGTRVLRLLSELEEGLAPDAGPAGESLPTPVARLRQEGDVPPESDAVPEPGPARRSRTPRPGSSRGSRRTSRR